MTRRKQPAQPPTEPEAPPRIEVTKSAWQAATAVPPALANALMVTPYETVVLLTFGYDRRWPDDTEAPLAPVANVVLTYQRFKAIVDLLGGVCRRLEVDRPDLFAPELPGGGSEP